MPMLVVSMTLFLLIHITVEIPALGIMAVPCNNVSIGAQADLLLCHIPSNPKNHYQYLRG
jgi:hypothetical protein